MQKNTIRLSGSEAFVKEAGDIVVEVFKKRSYGVIDSGTRDSSNPKYKGNYIRYIDVINLIILNSKKKEM